MKADWDGRPDSPRYVQATGRFDAGSEIVLNDDELIYIRLNARTHTPFGLGDWKWHSKQLTLFSARTGMRHAWRRIQSCSMRCGCRI